MWRLYGAFDGGGRGCGPITWRDSYSGMGRDLAGSTAEDMVLVGITVSGLGSVLLS